jgi:hypothetical protein
MQDSAAMERTGIHALVIQKQLKAKRTLLFNEFLRNPLNTSLAIEIRLLDDRIAEFNWASHAKAKVRAGLGQISSTKKEHPQSAPFSATS